MTSFQSISNTSLELDLIKHSYCSIQTSLAAKRYGLPYRIVKLLVLLDVYDFMQDMITLCLFTFLILRARIDYC